NSEGKPSGRSVPSRSAPSIADARSVRRRFSVSIANHRAGDMTRAMTRRWIFDGVGESTFAQLATELTGSALSSLLLEVMQHPARARSPVEVLAQYQRDPFCRPAAVDQRTSVAIDGHLLAAAAEFEAIELSPVAPLATCSSVGPTAQNRVLTALRSTEI